MDGWFKTIKQLGEERREQLEKIKQNRPNYQGIIETFIVRVFANHWMVDIDPETEKGNPLFLITDGDDHIANMWIDEHTGNIRAEFFTKHLEDR